MHHDGDEVGGDAAAAVGDVRLVAHNIDIVGHILFRGVDKGVFYEGVVRRDKYICTVTKVPFVNEIGRAPGSVVLERAGHFVATDLIAVGYQDIGADLRRHDDGVQGLARFAARSSDPLAGGAEVYTIGYQGACGVVHKVVLQCSGRGARQVERLTVLRIVGCKGPSVRISVLGGVRYRNPCCLARRLDNGGDIRDGQHLRINLYLNLRRSGRGIVAARNVACYVKFNRVFNGGVRNVMELVRDTGISTCGEGGAVAKIPSIGTRTCRAARKGDCTWGTEALFVGA